MSASDESKTHDPGAAVKLCLQDLQSDVSNCGTCGTTCPEGHQCVDGECTLIQVVGSCKAGQQLSPEPRAGYPLHGHSVRAVPCPA